jgi:hypothetical protein
MEQKYVPILKWKRGEYNSLADLFDETKKSIKPLIEITPPAWDFKANKFKKTVHKHAIDSVEKIAGRWGTRPFFADCRLIHNDKNISDRAKNYDTFFAEALNTGLLAVPITGLRRQDTYQAAVAKYTSLFGLGMGLRLTPIDLENQNVNNEIMALLRDLGVQGDDVDIIIDLRSVYEVDPGLVARASAVYFDIVNGISDWRSVILAASSLPSDLSHLNPSTLLHYLPRKEWAAWVSLMGKVKNDKPVVYGDYAIGNPDMAVLDPAQVNISASIRYTIDDHCLIFRGKGVKTPGSGGNKQYSAHCKRLIRMKEYCGRNFSAGDGYIFECAKERVGYGNAEKWIRVGTNHHMEFIVDRLANLGAL